jgi:hypothetical protein
MNRYWRLAIITILGMVAMCLLTWGLYVVRDAVQTSGYVVSPGLFLVAFFTVVGGMFSVAAHLAMREIKRLGVADQIEAGKQ